MSILTVSNDTDTKPISLKIINCLEVSESNIDSVAGLMDSIQ